MNRYHIALAACALAYGGMTGTRIWHHASHPGIIDGLHEYQRMQIVNIRARDIVRLLSYNEADKVPMVAGKLMDRLAEEDSENPRYHAMELQVLDIVTKDSLDSAHTLVRLSHNEKRRLEIMYGREALQAMDIIGWSQWATAGLTLIAGYCAGKDALRRRFYGERKKMPRCVRV